MKVVILAGGFGTRISEETEPSWSYEPKKYSAPCLKMDQNPHLSQGTKYKKCS